MKVACAALVWEADERASKLRMGYADKAREHRRLRAEERRRAEWANPDHARRQNAVAPIHRLPVELFGNILRLAESDTDLSRLRRLASVGRYWRDTVLSTPALWSTLSSSMPVTMLNWALQWSRKARLSVDYNHYSGSDQQSDLFVAAVVPHSDRWKSLKINTGNIQRIASFNIPVPKLVTLDISCTQSTQFTLGDGAQLRSISVRRVRLPWASPRLSGLTDITLGDLNRDASPTMSQFVAMMQSSPELADLELGRIDIDDQTPPEDNALPSSGITVPLVRLRRVSIMDISEQTSFGILRRMAIPNCEWFALRTHRRGSESDEPAPILPILEQVLHLITKSVYVGIEDASTTIRTQTALNRIYRPIGLDVQLGGRTRRTSETIGEISQLLMMAKVTTTELRVKSSSFPPEQLVDFPSCKKLHLSVHGHAVQSILENLNEEYISETGETSYPCPELKYINMAAVSGLPVADLRRTVRDRWEKYKEPERGSKPPKGLIDVVVPIGRSGREERWRPIQKAKK